MIRVMDFSDYDGVMQAVRFQCYRENIYGALELVETAHARHPDPRYAAEAARIRSWLRHLDSREAYVGAQESQYRRLRWRAGLKLLEKRIRMALGRKTRKMVERRGRNPEFQELERDIAAVKPERVLDAGCGAGHTALAFAPRVAEVVALDLTEAMLAQGRKLAKQRDLTNIMFQRGDVEKLAFDDASFDLVTSRYSAHHYPHPLAAVRECARVLRPGGRLLLGLVKK
jgi:SAM-dependent methyltransferase